MSTSQYGFRSGKSTVDAIETLKEITRTTNFTYVATILVDIKGAFDHLWWPEVINNLQRINVSKTLFNTLKSYLSQRQVEITYDQETLTREMDLGCPQGSVLGPYL